MDGEPPPLQQLLPRLGQRQTGQGSLWLPLVGLDASTLPAILPDSKGF